MEKTTIAKLRSRFNRVHNLFSEYERLNALRRAIERDKEFAKRKDADNYYENIVKRMAVIEQKLNVHLPEIEE